jgi:hypothetical protein
MVAIRLEDAGHMTSRVSLSGWHCLLCGEVVEPGIAANRVGHHEPVRDRTRPHYLADPADAKRKRIKK